MVFTMSYLRFILIGTAVDKCQQIENKADLEQYTVFEI